MLKSLQYKSFLIHLEMTSLLLLTIVISSGCLRRSDDIVMNHSEETIDLGCGDMMVSTIVNDQAQCVPALMPSRCLHSELSAYLSGECEVDANCFGGASCVDGCCFQNVCRDGDVRECSGDCGMGQEVCIEGSFGECMTQGSCVPGSVDTEPCALCGTRERRCGSDCQWENWQTCRNEQACNEGDRETRLCPSGCGEQFRVCEAGCQWGGWSICNDDGLECRYGEQQEETCGSCGEVRVRSCTNICFWGAWSECQAVGCVPGEIENRSCGDCLYQTRVCSDQCDWEEWGECQFDTCPLGMTETRTCGNCGQQTRTCTDRRCGWSEWSECTGQGSCTPGTEQQIECGVTDIGECQLGVQVAQCNQQCSWVEGQCRGAVLPALEVCGSRVDTNCDGELLRAPDPYEANDTCGSCTILNADSILTITGTIDHYNDSDYFCFEVIDRFIPFQNLTISLNVPSDQDYDLYLYQNLADCETNNFLRQSTLAVGQPELIEVSEQSTSIDDSGTYIVRIQPLNSASCDDEYELTIDPF